ncbi:winged helix-turn-helix transcriptional regulator [Stutzerimonas nitrititolerans]|uniref:winged helix-turn-helix transcriptional regulator n=1 Tax=Stutzerimonas nitrititolerans TaxID=2482751 RepID=UPI0028AFD16A|nr:winged helix-turn-helix transcriptional regulator [Stutzerimonas nitrititolerans]
MQNYAYDRVNTLAAHEAARQEIARKMEEFEAEHGPVETLPILNHDKRIPFQITCPEKKRALSENQAKTRSRGKVNEARQQIRARNRERVMSLAGCRLTPKAIAERTGLSVTTVRSILKEAAA